MDKYNKMRILFEQYSNSERAREMSKYMRNMFKFYGIPTPIRKSLYKDFLKEEKQSKQVDWNFLNQCFQDEHREFQYLVYDYLIKLNKFLSYEDISKIENYIRNKQWWDTIDFFDQVIGTIGLNDPRVDSLMLAWSKNPNFWVRRLAIDYQLGRKEKTNTKLLEQILVNNLNSEEFFINKAIGWALRDYSKTNPEWVRKFIQSHKENMAKLSIKEASKYI